MLIDFRTPRVAVLCSKRAPGIDYVLRHPDFGTMYEVACVVTTEESLNIETCGVPLIHHSPRAFDVRAEFDAITAETLQPFDIDVVVLLSYLYILTAPMLEAFPGRILNVHDADLTLLSSDGRPRYPGKGTDRAGQRCATTSHRSPFSRRSCRKNARHDDTVHGGSPTEGCRSPRCSS